MTVRAMKWRIVGNEVLRGNSVIAQISCIATGNYRWDGMGMHRVGFDQAEDVLADVKYYHRYPSRRRTTFTFASGRKVVFE